MKHLFRWFFRLILLVALLFAGFLGYMSITDYSPKARESAAIQGQSPERIFASGDTLSLLIWNIGYAGLGAEMDFFFDGGSRVRPEKEENSRYLQGITSFLAQQSSTDFVLLQEVDRNSKRSYHTDQVVPISQALPRHNYSFALNYKTAFVPQPLSEPYGKVVGGLLSLSRTQPIQSTRYRLKADADWPMGLFMLDRCFLSQRYSMDSGKELVVVNLHLSAYDDGGVKQNQMDSLAAFLHKEEEQGNVVLLGGDWNQIAPDKPLPKPMENAPVTVQQAPKEFPNANWQWAVPEQSTNRWLLAPYMQGTSQEACIDYFLVSPGVQVLQTNRLNLNFAYSDHEPVWMHLILP